MKKEHANPYAWRRKNHLRCWRTVSHDGDCWPCQWRWSYSQPGGLVTVTDNKLPQIFQHFVKYFIITTVLHLLFEIKFLQNNENLLVVILPLQIIIPCGIKNQTRWRAEPIKPRKKQRENRPWSIPNNVVWLGIIFVTPLSRSLGPTDTKIIPQDI